MVNMTATQMSLTDWNKKQAAMRLAFEITSTIECEKVRREVSDNAVKPLLHIVSQNIDMQIKIKELAEWVATSDQYKCSAAEILKKLELI